MSAARVTATGLVLVLCACGGGGGGGSDAVAASSSSSSSGGALVAESCQAVSGTPAAAGPRIILVSSVQALNAALSDANPGDVIELAAGTYQGSFVTSRSGTATQPITLRGPAAAVLQNNATTGKRYGLYLNGANYWVLDGFTVSHSQKGIVTDRANFNVLKNLTVHTTEDEGVHFRQFSCDNTLQGSNIYNIGLVQPQYGEGVYLGSAKSNWSTYTGSANLPDASHRNKVLNNTIGPDVAAEGIDVKEGTRDGLIQGNTFIGTGIKGQNSGDSVIDMKGDGYLVKGNTVTNTPTAASNFMIDGFQVHENAVNGISYGHNNTFNGNTINLNTTGPEGAAGYIALPAGSSQGYGIQVGARVNGTVVCSNNTVLNAIATRGLSNMATSACP